MTSKPFLTKWRMAAGGVALGVICFAAAAAGGDPWGGLAAGALIAGYAVVLTAGGSRETAVLLRGDGDERHRRIGDEAASLTLGIVAPLLVVGFLWELSQGYYGKFGVMCSVTGFLLMVTPLYLARRR